MPYATRDHVFQLALAAQAFVALARPFDAVDPTTGTIRIKAHGYSDQDLLTFEVAQGGDNATPRNVQSMLVYRARPISADLFQVALLDGTLVDYFVDSGIGWSVAVDPFRRLDLNLVERASFIDDHLTAHQPPILPDPVTGQYPFVLIGMNARLAARQTVNCLQFENSAYRVAVDRLFESAVADDEVLKSWKAGKPIQPRPTDGTIADNSARASAGRPPVPWTTEVL